MTYVTKNVPMEALFKIKESARLGKRALIPQHVYFISL